MKEAREHDRLPLLLSVPHAGTWVPPEAAPYCVLSRDEIRADGDGGAREIYALDDDVVAFHTTDVARAIVDQNRAPDDVRKDGVVKTHTCWDVPVYDPSPPPAVLDGLVRRYHAPYHARLRELSAAPVLAGVDCHTMAAVAPPEAPDPGSPRPRICLSDAHGTLPPAWADAFAEALAEAFEEEPSRNDPFNGGYIIREHSGRLPWIQLELSREPWLPLEEKRRRLRLALQQWCTALQDLDPAGYAAGSGKGNGAET